MTQTQTSRTNFTTEQKVGFTKLTQAAANTFVGEPWHCLRIGATTVGTGAGTQTLVHLKFSALAAPLCLRAKQNT